jgi:SnoaL-like domain
MVTAELPAIVDALYRFGAGQDLGDRELFASAFAADATLDFTNPAARFDRIVPVFKGRDGIADAVFGAIAGLATTHSVTNPRATVDGDTAELFALVEAQHVPRETPERHLLLKNLYRVGLVRSGSDWLIERLDIEIVWYEGDPTVLFG